MGYTHYFTTNADNTPNDKEWNEIVQKVMEIFDKHHEIICVEYDEPDFPAVVNGELIRFNGKGKDGHETLFLERSQNGFDCCKTNEKPYDVAVVEVLQAVKDICPHWIKLSSDGDWEGKKVFS